MPKFIPEIISREAAYAKGQKRFYTGVPCRRGHLSQRQVSNGACIECMHSFKGVGTPDPWNENLIWSIFKLKRPKHWDIVTLEACTKLLQETIEAFAKRSDAPPPPPSITPKGFRKIYGERYFTATVARMLDGQDYPLWYTQTTQPRAPFYVEDQGERFELLNREALTGLPWVFVKNEWYAYDQQNDLLIPVVLPERKTTALVKFGVDGSG